MSHIFMNVSFFGSDNGFEITCRIKMETKRSQNNRIIRNIGMIEQEQKN